MIMLAYAVSCLLAVASAIFAFKYRKLPGSYPFLFLSVLSGLSALGSSMEYSSLTLEAKLVWRNFQQIGYLYSPVAVLLLALAYSSGSRSQTVRHKLFTGVGMSLVPTAALLLIYTNPSHHLMRKSVALGLEGTLVLERTLWNHLSIAYGGLLFLWAVLLLIKTMIFTRGLARKQMLFLLAGLLFPSIVSTLRSFHLFPITGAAASVAVTYIPSFFFLIWAMFKYQLLEVVPIARNKLFDVLREGIVVLDADTRVLDLNEAAKAMLARIGGAPPGPLSGQRLDSFVRAILVNRKAPGLEHWMDAHHSSQEREFELHVMEEGGHAYELAVKVIPVHYGARLFAGSMSVLTDITEMKRNERELQRRAVTDGLTGIYNRNGFIEYTEQAMQDRGEADSGQLCLLVMDIDYFKAINDRHGHQAGDQALLAFVKCVVGRKDPSWLFGRIGGEEFALTLPNVAHEQALAFAEAIRDEVERSFIPASDGSRISFTVSIGLAFQTPDIRTFESLYSRADHSLYEAKQNGRNRIHMAVANYTMP